MSRYQEPGGAADYDHGAADYHATAGGYRGLGSEYPTGDDDGVYRRAPASGRASSQGHGGHQGSGRGEGRTSGRGGSGRGGKPSGDRKPGGGKAGGGRSGGGKAGGGRSGGGKSGGGRRRLSAFGRRPVLGIVAIFGTMVLTGMALTAYGAYRNVYDSIHHVDVNGMLGKRPPKLNGSLNVLMIGSDSRAGSHGKYGSGIDGSRSDTTMLLHISPKHDHVSVVSFPRDSMVPVFKCDREDKNHPGQQAGPGTVERLNTTFSNGGAPCLWYTLEQTTKIHIDHFMEVDFSGFKKIVNDLGGVNVCLPFAINDPASRLHLAKGQHVIGGAQALAFVRERHIGLGSDLQRIQRQQLFLASVAQKISSSGVLGDPTKMYTLVHDVASSLTTDTGLSLTDMYAIANSLKDLSTKALRFISVPVVPYPGDPGAEVQWASPISDQLFQAIAKDTGISKAADNAAKDHPSPGPTVSPSHVQLQVLNGTTVEGLATTTASKLKANGFSVTGFGNATSDSYTNTVIEYSSASQMPQVNTIKNAIAGAEAKLVSGLPAGSIQLVLGSTFKGVAGASTPKSASQPKTPKIGNNYGGISGNTNICRDSGAFNGPDTPQMFTP